MDFMDIFDILPQYETKPYPVAVIICYSFWDIAYGAPERARLKPLRCFPFPHCIVVAQRIRILGMFMRAL